jgi:hypothetical protein
MDTTLLARFSPTIKNLSGDSLRGADLPSALLLERDGPLSVFYAPFEYVNLTARVVIVGITPGSTQTVNALMEAQRQMRAGSTPEKTCMAVKQTASFSGPMRENLVAMLESIGLHTSLGITSCHELFNPSKPLAHMASLLKYPVFSGGRNYNGTPDPLKHPVLAQYVREYFAKDAKSLAGAVFVPLGDKVATALRQLATEGYLDSKSILNQMPHPSGANGERIAYFLGRKEKSSLSMKTDSRKIDEARASLIAQVLAIKKAA